MHPINFTHCSYAFLVAIVSGAVNSVAGGGTLLTFPVLVKGCGLDEKIANATNTVGLLPAALMGAIGHKHGEPDPNGMQVAAPFFIASLLGGIAGSLLLIYTSAESFKAVLPWLILMAAVIFLLNDQIMKYLIKPAPPSAVDVTPAQKPPVTRKRALAFQFLIAVYGGYFGAGIGIMMLAALSLMRAGGIYRMNYLKNLAAFAINGVSSVLFVIWGMVQWPIAISMAAGAVLGGWGGAGIAKKVGPRWTRRFVSAVGLSIAAWMLFNQFSKRL